MHEFSKFIINKDQHRKLIGYLGLSLPVLLIIGNLFFGCSQVQDSISHYYHTFMRDFLVGIIVLIGMFFIGYLGYPEDKVPFRIAGISVLLVAFFPTSLDVGACDNCLEFICTNRSFSISKYVHGVGAFAFFTTLTYICLFLFTNNKNIVLRFKETKIRHFIIKTCGIIMLVDIIVIVLFLLFESKITEQIGDLNLLFYLEVIALFAFSIAWLVKGKFIYILDNKTEL